jgi:hypothetical protein
MRCPVCKSEDVVASSASEMTCNVCKTTDHALQFSPMPDQVDLAGEQATFDIGNGQQLTHFYPPDEIALATKRIDDYFRGIRGARSWAYGPIQSRVSVTPVVPNATRDTIRAQAAAFGCDVIPRAEHHHLVENDARYVFLRSTDGVFPINAHGNEFDLFGEWRNDIGAPDSEFDDAVDRGRRYRDEKAQG